MADKTIHDVVGKLLELHSLKSLLWSLACQVDMRCGGDGPHPDAEAIRGILPNLTKAPDEEAIAVDLLRTGGVTAAHETPAEEAAAMEQLLRQQAAAAETVPRVAMPMHPTPWAFLAESGLLFEINRTVLHPVGLAIVVDGPSPGEEGSTTFSGLWDEGQRDPEGILFDAKSVDEGAAKFRRWLSLTGQARLLARHSALGYVVQKAEVPGYTWWAAAPTSPGAIGHSDGPQNLSPYAQKLHLEIDTLHGDLAKLRETLDVVGWPPAGEGDLITEQASAALLEFHGKAQALAPKPLPVKVPGTRETVPEGWTLSATPPGDVGRIYFQGETPPPLPEGWRAAILAVPEAKLWTADPACRGAVSYGGDELMEAAAASGVGPAGSARHAYAEHEEIGAEDEPLAQTSPASMSPCAATVNGITITCFDPIPGDGFLRFVIAGRPKHPDQAAVGALLFGTEPIRIAIEGLPFAWKVYVPSFPNEAYATWQRKRFAEGQTVSITFTCAMDPAPLDVEPATEGQAVVGIATKTVQKGELLGVDLGQARMVGQPPNPHTGEFAGLPFAYKTITVKTKFNPCGGNNPLYRIEVELDDEAMEDGHEAFTKRLRAYSGTQAHPLSLATLGGPLNVRAVEWPGVSRSHRRVTFLEMPEQPITAAYMRAALAKLAPPGEFDDEERVLLTGQKNVAENGVYKITRVETTPVYLGMPRPYITLADLEPRVERGVVLSALRESRWVDLYAPAGKAKLDTLFLDASAEFDALAAPHAARQYLPDLVKRVTCDLALGILYRRHGDAGVVPPPRPLSDLQALLHPSGTGSSRSQSATSPASKGPDAALLAELHSLHQSGESLSDTFHRLLDQARIEGAQRVTQRIDKGLADLLHGDE